MHIQAIHYSVTTVSLQCHDTVLHLPNLQSICILTSEPLGRTWQNLPALMSKIKRSAIPVPNRFQMSSTRLVYLVFCADSKPADFRLSCHVTVISTVISQSREHSTRWRDVSSQSAHTESQSQGAKAAHRHLLIHSQNLARARSMTPGGNSVSQRIQC